MTTASDIISSALRKINSVDAGEALGSNDFTSGLSALNRMLRRWEANGLSMGWNDVSTPTETVPLPPEAEDAVINNLALVLSPEYGANPSQMLVSMAQATLSDLRRDRFVANPLVTNTDMPRGGGQRWNIYTDSPGGYW